MVRDTSWSTHVHNVPDGVYCSPRIHADGPALQSMLIELIVELADAAHGKGEAADAWDAYTTARLNHAAAREFGAEDVDTAALEAAEAIALTDVLEVLEPRLSMLPDEALTLARRLEYTALAVLRETGRVAP